MRRGHLAIAALAAAFASATGACVAPANAPEEPVRLPFAVAEYHSPDGFWGDGEKPPQNGRPAPLTLTRGCPNRPSGAAGECYTITYIPDAKRFAGINWQFPHNNWGQSRGLRVEPGAKQIVVSARGEKGGEHVQFGAGQPPNADTSRFPFGDKFDLSKVDASLDRDWKSFTVPFRGESYDSDAGVLCAFLIAFTAGDSDDPVTVYVDDIRWEK